jgi:AGCS family alanine or glycine:cation symporter
MKKLFTLLFSMLVLSNSVLAVPVDEQINTKFELITGWFVDSIFAEIPLTSTVSIPWVLIILIAGATYFTFYFRFINFGGLKTSIKVVRGNYDSLEEDDQASENKDGEVSHFQALTTALSATVGLGNIAGVAIAISIGGPGATFWMILAGFLGMASKFVECTLGVAYREINSRGTVFGGPMYYLKKGLKEKGFARLGRILAIIFAVMCIGGSFGGGNMFQSNQAFKMFEYVTGGEQSFIHGNGWIFGLVMAILVGIVIIGGIRKIASVTDKIVPAMVVMYMLACGTILVLNYDLIPNAFQAIFDGVFTPAGATGGFVGVLIQGFRRGSFSNEAGVGSASIAHAAVKTKYPASEGLVALLEPLIDTVIVCTMTALVLIITGQYTIGAELTDEQGVVLTSKALESGISWFPYVLTVAVVLFAFSSMISWSYYGYQAWTFLFGRSKKAEYLYKTMFCIFVVIGAAASLGAVTAFSDALVFAMLVPNMIGLYLLLPRVKQELNRYKKAIQLKEKA